MNYVPNHLVFLVNPIAIAFENLRNMRYSLFGKFIYSIQFPEYTKRSVRLDCLI